MWLSGMVLADKPFVDHGSVGKGALDVNSYPRSKTPGRLLCENS
jgi:hypothetical protein